MSINASSPAIATTPSGVLARIATWTMRHRRITLVAWIVALVGVTLGAQAIGTRQATNFTLPGTESQRAVDLLQSKFPTQAGDQDQIVFRATNGPIDTQAQRARIQPMLREVAKQPHVSDVVSPFSRAGSDAISKDGRIAFATVNFDERANDLPKSAADRVISIAQVRSPTNFRSRSGVRRSSRRSSPRSGSPRGSESWPRSSSFC
jgi:RND superfamily putative drug exporter